MVGSFHLPTNHLCSWNMQLNYAASQRLATQSPALCYLKHPPNGKKGHGVSQGRKHLGQKEVRLCPGLRVGTSPITDWLHNPYLESPSWSSTWSPVLLTAYLLRGLSEWRQKGENSYESKIHPHRGWLWSHLKWWFLKCGRYTWWNIIRP